MNGMVGYRAINPVAPFFSMEVWRRGLSGREFHWDEIVFSAFRREAMSRAFTGASSREFLERKGLKDKRRTRDRAAGASIVEIVLQTGGPKRKLKGLSWNENVK